MIVFRVNLLGKITEVPLYHRWEINPSNVIRWKDVSGDSIGSYVMFDDGSELLVKIVGYAKGAVRTESGVFRQDDLVHICNPKHPRAAYSGMYGREEHHLVRPYGRQEKALATRAINGEKLRIVTPRIAMNIQQRVASEFERQGFTVEESISHIIQTCRKPGRDQLKANEMALKMMGVDPNKPPQQEKPRGGAFSNLQEVEVVKDNKLGSVSGKDLAFISKMVGK